MWGLLKGVKIGLRIALRGLVFEIEAILEDTYYLIDKFAPNF